MLNSTNSNIIRWVQQVELKRPKISVVLGPAETGSGLWAPQRIAATEHVDPTTRKTGRDPQSIYCTLGRATATSTLLCALKPVQT